MASNRMLWINENWWEILGCKGERVQDVRDGVHVGWRLFLTDLSGHRWERRPAHTSVTDPDFVQDVTTHLFIPHVSLYHTLENVRRVVLSPLEALVMVNSGVQQGVITAATFAAAYNYGEDVQINAVSLIYQGTEIIRPVSIVSALRTPGHGYLEFNAL